MRQRLPLIVACVFFGFAGMIGGLIMTHLYTDHQALHDIIRMINAAQQTKPAAPVPGQ